MLKMLQFATFFSLLLLFMWKTSTFWRKKRRFRLSGASLKPNRLARRFQIQSGLKVDRRTQTNCFRWQIYQINSLLWSDQISPIRWLVLCPDRDQNPPPAVRRTLSKHNSESFIYSSSRWAELWPPGFKSIKPAENDFKLRVLKNVGGGGVKIKS